MMRALALASLAALTACQDRPAEQRTAAPAASAAAPAASSTPTSTPAAKPVACAAGETPIFSCTFADRKRVAVCGVASGKAEYRFGGDAPEIVLGGGENAYAMYSGGGESQLAFTNGDTRYIVFSRMVRTRFDGEGNEPAISDGIVIDRAGQFVAMRQCESDVLPVDVNAAETYLSSGERELFTEETMRADPAGDE